MALRYEDFSSDIIPDPLPEAVLIMPARNEATRLQGDPFKQALNSYATAFSNAFTHDSQYRLLLVENGSTTRETGDIAERHGFEVERLSLSGKGRAIRHGVKTIMNSLGNPDPTNMHIAFADSDGAYQPQAIFNLLEHTMGDADIAVAQRVVTAETPKEDLSRRLAHVIIQKYMELSLPTGVSDPNAGAMAFSGDAITLWETSVLNGYTTPAEVLYRAKKSGLIAVEAKAVVTNPTESRVRPLTDGIQLIRDIAQIRRTTR